MPERIRTLADGRLEFTDEETGEVRVQSYSKEAKNRIADGKDPIDYTHRYRRMVYRKNANGVTLYLPSAMSMEAKSLPDDYVYLKDDEETRSDILILLGEGWSLRKICSDPDMPTYGAVFNLIMKDPEFKDQVEEARKQQAERQKEKLEGLVDEIYDDDTAKVAKAKGDILKFLMSVNDKERYGGQKVAAEGGTNITFIVNTGIQREPQEAIPVDGRVIEQEAADHIDGLLAAPSSAADSPEPEEIQCAGLPPESRENSALHQRADRPVSEEHEA